MPRGSRLLLPLIVLTVLLFATVGQGQYVEDSIHVGGAWVGSMAYNPREDVVYGSCQYRDGIFFAIDCATNEVIESWRIDWPMRMAYDSIDQKLYLPFGFHAESLAVIDGRTHQRIKAIPLEWARLCVWDGMRDKLYVSCPERNVVAVFDCTQDSLVAEIPVSGYPLKMYVNGRHRKLYVLNYDGESVSIVNTATNQVIRTIPLGHYARSGYYSAAAGKFYVDSYEDVTVIDGVGDTVVAQVALPQGASAWSMADNPRNSLVLLGIEDGLGLHAAYSVDASRGRACRDGSVPGSRAGLHRSLRQSVCLRHQGRGRDCRRAGAGEAGSSCRDADAVQVESRRAGPIVRYRRQAGLSASEG